MQAMILAAGEGSRLKPITDSIPKPLIQINGYTMLENTIQYLKNNGVTRVVINVHHHAQQIIDYIKANNNFDIEIFISDESDELKNTGGGIVKASKYFNGKEPVIITVSDILTNLALGDMMAFHKQQEALVTLAVKGRKTSRNLLFDTDCRLAGWKNNKTGELKMVEGRTVAANLAFSGIHIIEPKFFEMVISQGNFNIINEYLLLAENCKIVGYNHSSDIWLEFGRLHTLEEAKTNSIVKNLQANLFN